MYWNIDFDLDAGFSAYVVLLVVSGLIMLILGITGLGEQTGWERAINVLVGLAFFGYGFYLALLFNGGTYWIVFKAFIVPAVLIFNVIRNAITRRKEKAAGQVEAQPNPYPPYAAQPNPYAAQPPVPTAQPMPAPVSPVQEQ